MNSSRNPRCVFHHQNPPVHGARKSSVGVDPWRSWVSTLNHPQPSKSDHLWDFNATRPKKKNTAVVRVDLSMFEIIRYYQMDWFKGKSTGNQWKPLIFSLRPWACPVNFPIIIHYPILWLIGAVPPNYDLYHLLGCAVAAKNVNDLPTMTWVEPSRTKKRMSKLEEPSGSKEICPKPTLTFSSLPALV